MAIAQKYLDTRRVKADGTFPVKLRIGDGKKVKLYTTKHSLTVKDFERVIKGGGNSPALKEVSEELDTLHDKAKEIIKSLTPFDFSLFETRLYQRGDRLDLLFLLQEKADSLKASDNIANGNLYQQSHNLLAEYQLFKNRSNTLSLTSVDAKYLKSFENWALKVTRVDRSGNTLLKYSLTTLGMYLIRVRAIFNNAISDRVIPSSIYPFHTPQNNRGYQIQKGEGNKRALTKEQINYIHNYTPLTKNEAFAKDIFLFSCLGSGMNCIDIFSLKWQDIENDTITFIRKKTGKRVKTDLIPQMVEIIETHGSHKIGNDYIFNVIKANSTEADKIKSVRVAIAAINKNLKIIAGKLGITTEISTYFARHSFSTILLNDGATPSIISRQLGHTSTKTTESYLGEFKSGTAKKFISSIIEENKTA
jgi:integrase/recombinase XerD